MIDIDISVPFRLRWEVLALTDTASTLEAYEGVEAAGLGDGLPIVPPTQSLIAFMLQGLRTRPEELVAPQLFPSMQAPTLWDVAVHAVMAGCRPEALPIIVAALRAMADDEYNLLGVQTTTGSATPVVIVHGPAAADAGISGGANCMGQGSRGNATVGRAVRLLLQNLAGAVPGISDMATLGQPGKYSWCFAENNAENPFPPLHAIRGLPAQSSAVTVMPASGSEEVVLVGSSAEEYAACLGRRLLPRSRETMVVLPPEAANLYAPAGWDRDRWIEAILKAAPPTTNGETRSTDDLILVIAGGVGIKAALIPSWGLGSRAVTASIKPL
jgi:hypothetical protein